MPLLPFVLSSALPRAMLPVFVAPARTLSRRLARPLRWLTLTLGTGAALFAAGQTYAAGFDNLARLADKGFIVSAQARMLDTGETLASISPALQLTPASLSKLYIAGAALDRFGPQYRFSTRLRSTGTISDGVLNGDLVLEGSGDPALTSEELWRLTEELRFRGIRRVNGRLLVSQWRFGPVPCISTDRCNASRRSSNAYDALLSSAASNYASWCVKVLPGVGSQAPARLASCDMTQPSETFDNQVTTVAAGGKNAINARRTTTNGRDTLVVSGTIAADSQPRSIYRAVSNPALYTGYLMRDMLTRAGISVTGGVDLTSTAPPSSAVQLGSVEGKPMQELLTRMLNYSNNFMADQLTLALVGGSQATLRQGGAKLETFASAIPNHGPLTMYSGSGLTSQNRTSVNGLIALLDSMYHRPALFPTFVAGMQAPTNGPMRFIRRGSETFRNHVMVKTGTLNQPVPVRAISGYFRTQNGRWGAFAVMVNGRAAVPYLSWPQVLDPVAEDLTAMIERN